MAGLAGRTVLVVEDAYYLAMDVKAALQEAGAKVLGPFGDCAEALSRLEQDRPDCAVLDVNLGDGPTFELARAMQMRSIPFIFFTGYERSAIPQEFAHVVRLEKPAPYAEIVRAVERELG